MSRLHFGDPYRAFDQYDADTQDELANLPTCCECGEPIQEDECYKIGDDLYCVGCMEEHKKPTELFMKEVAPWIRM